jgi:hypothetical protein
MVDSAGFSMFANIAHQHSTHFFPHPTRYADENDCESSPLRPASGKIAHDDRHHDLGSDGFRQKLHRTQQHGQSVHRARFIPRQREQMGVHDQKTGASEHMLRRKTPTGTLAAGYDGRPVEWAGRPHATKHFVMPISTAAEETAYQSFSPVEPNKFPRQTGFPNCFSTTQEQGHIWYGTADENLDNENVIPSGDMMSNFIQPVSLDSVLNQGSWSYPYGSLACEQRNPTVLQPMWPPNLGFTALNDAEQHGPHWASDGYGPHRLTPFHVPYYCPQPIESQTLGSNRQQSTFGYIRQRKVNPEELVPGQKLGQRQFERVTEHGFAGDYLGQDENQHRTFSFQHENSAPQYHQFALTHRAKYRSTKPVLDRDISYRDHSLGFRPANHCKTSRASTLKSGILTDQAQFKEKVLLWAHRVYGSLVVSVQQSRRNLLDGHHHSDRCLASTIYLKPPGLSFSSSDNAQVSIDRDNENIQTRDGYVRESKNNTSYQGTQWQQNSVTYNSSSDNNTTPLQGSNINQSHQGQDFRYRWQINDRQDSSPNMVTSVFTESLPISVGASSVPQHETSPKNAAITALEILDRLCQESGWKWTVGILLSGCLAYGLGNYNKAMNCYLRVLLDDSK